MSALGGIARRPGARRAAAWIALVLVYAWALWTFVFPWLDRTFISRPAV